MPKRGSELLVHIGQAQEQLVGLFLVLKMRHVEGLDEIEVESPWRHRRRPFVWCTKEQVSLACGLALLPFKLVLPDLVPRHIGLVRALHDTPDRLVVVAVEL